MGPKAGYELAQLLANLRTGKSSPGAGPTAKPVAKEPLLTTDKSQLGPKGVLPDSSRDALLTHTQTAERKNAGKIQLSSKTLITTKGLINQQGGKELNSEALAAESKTTPAGEKPVIPGTSVASGSQKTPVLGGKKLTPETPTADSKTAVAGEKTAITDGQDIAGGRKTPVSNDSFPAVQDKSAAPRQKVPVDLEKPALIAQKLKQALGLLTEDAKVPDVVLKTGMFSIRKPEQGSRTFPTAAENKDVFNSQTNKADTTRRSHPGTPGLSELMDGSVKEPPDNPSGKLLLQNLNQAQVQVSAGQTKDRSSLTSGNSSNSNFEQVLSNNAQAPVAEQTSASVQTAKAASNASPGNSFASVSEQLQESIHSSLRQGDQQLTIRLNPPELGRVFIKFQGKGDQITGLLEVDRAQTRYEIEQALPQIIRNLAECGVQIKRLEVVLTNQQEHHAFKDPSLAAEQDGAEGNNPNHDTFGTNEWLTDDPNYSGFSEPREMLIADDFVDVLV